MVTTFDSKLCADDVKLRADNAKVLDPFKSQDDFYHTIQSILEQYHLHPFPRKGEVIKSNLQDGVIERQTHGAMHAVRVSIYVLIFHELNKRYLPKEVKEKIAILTKRFELDEFQLMRATQLAAIFHNVGREHEGPNKWEQQSGEKFLTFLRGEEKFRRHLIFSWIYYYAVRHKNNPALFKKELAEKLDWCDESPELLEASDYIRQLLHDANSLDAMRLVDHFFMDRLEIYQKAVEKGLYPLKYKLIDLVQHSHKLLYIHGDLLGEARIRANEKNSFAVHTAFAGPSFLLEIKAGYEHSSNVYQAMLESFLQNSFFAEFFQDDFHLIAQKALEQSYLQPFPKDGYSVFKPNLQDGIIERETHGAMHAVRVSLYVQIFNELNRQYRQKEVDEIFSILTEAFGLDRSQLMRATQLAGLLHDAAREGEGTDQWEKQSGEKLFSFLMKNENFRISRQRIALAWVYRYAVQFKDHPDLFEEELTKKLKFFDKFSPEVIKACDYLRHLVHEADCLDIMRCVGVCHIYQLETYQIAIAKRLDGFRNVIVRVARHNHALLYTQGDLLWDCKINISEFDPEYKPTLNNGRRFLLKVKTGFEHASNVYQSVLTSFLKDYFFKRLFDRILDVKLVTTKRFERVHAGFSPFLHGTNSSVLSLLPRTNFKFLSPITLLSDYLMAPMSGEIFKGGLTDVADGRMCFGRLNSKGKGEFTLEKIIGNYAFHRSTIPDAKTLQEELAQCIELKFYKLNEFMVQLCRAKQGGTDISTLNSKELLEELQLAIQFYYVMLCLADHVTPNLTEFKKHAALNTEFCGAKYCDSSQIGKIQRKFTTHYIKHYIKDNALDVRAIWKNPTQENLELLCKMFEITSGKGEIKSGLDVKSANDKVTLRLFIAQTPKKVIKRHHDPNFYLRCFIEPGLTQNQFENILNEMFYIHYHVKGGSGTVKSSVLGPPYHSRANYVEILHLDNLTLEELKLLVVTPNSFQDLDALAKTPAADFSTFNLEALEKFLVLKPKLLPFLNMLEKRYKTLQAIFADQRPLNFSATEQAWIKKPFPLLLMSEGEEDVEMYDFGTREFRVRKDCDVVLGQQISLMATDTAENKQNVEEWLQKHNLDVPVILFSELKLGAHPASLIERWSVIERWLNLHIPKIQEEREVEQCVAQKSTEASAQRRRPDPVETIMGYLYAHHRSYNQSNASSSKPHSQSLVLRQPQID